MLALFLSTTLNDKTTEPDIQLTDLEPASINTIKIIRSTADEILFQKEGGKWWMHEPYHLPANEFRINTLLRLSGAHSYTRFRKNEVELERFLLDEPVVSVEFDNTRIDFGDTSPLGEQRYVLVNDAVHLINDSLYQQLQTPATFFLSTKLLPENAGIKAINLPGYRLSQHDGIWEAVPQLDYSADNITTLIHAWRSADAISIRAYEDGENSGTIRIELEDGNIIEFIIVTPPPQLVLARSDIGLQYHISGNDAEQLFLQPITNHESPVTD
jgi:hypothetical protein